MDKPGRGPVWPPLHPLMLCEPTRRPGAKRPPGPPGSTPLCIGSMAARGQLVRSRRRQPRHIGVEDAIQRHVVAGLGIGMLALEGFYVAPYDAL